MTRLNNRKYGMKFDLLDEGKCERSCFSAHQDRDDLAPLAEDSRGPPTIIQFVPQKDQTLAEGIACLDF